MKKTIEEVYGNFAKGRLFTKHCHSLGLIELEDLKDLDFSAIELPGIGKGTLKTIEEIFLSELEDGLESKKVVDEIDIPLSIEEVFLKEKKGTLFIDYCQNQGWIWMNDLRTFDFYKCEVPGIGKSSLKRLEEKYKEVVQEIKDIVNVEDILQDIHKDNYYIALSRVAHQEKEKIILKKYHLLDKDINDLKEIEFSDEDFFAIRKVLTPFKNSKIEEFYTDFEKRVKVRNREIFLLRSQGKTLEAIGEQQGMTRERVRQICAKIQKLMVKEAIVLLDALIRDEKRGIFLSELRWKIEDHQRYLILKQIIFDTEEYTYLPFSDRIVKTDNIPCDFFEKLDSKIEVLLNEGYIDYYELTEQIVEFYTVPFFEREEVDDYLDYKGYKLSGQLVTTRRPPIWRICNDAVVNYFDFDIKLDSDENNEDMERLKDIIRKKYRVEIDGNNRALTAAATRAGSDLVLSGRGRYVPIDKVKEDMQLFQRIYNYILHAPFQPVNIADLFEIYKESLLELTNIDNHNFLHGVLRYYYGEDLKFSREAVTFHGADATSIDEQIIKILDEKQRKVHFDELLDFFPSLTKIRMNFIHSRNREIIYLGKDLYQHHNLVQYFEDYSDEILRLLNENNRYISAAKLYEDFSENKSLFLSENNIEDDKALLEVLSAQYGDMFFFKHPHILPLDHQLKSVSTLEIARKQLDFTTNFDFVKYFDYAQKMKWSEQTTGALFSSIERYVYKCGFCSTYRETEK